MYRYNKVSKLTIVNIKPVLETCLILANKYCCDFEIENAGPLELHLLETIKWNLYITVNEYNDFEKHITQLINLY